MKTINVYIADDHPVVRKGMSRLLTTFRRVNSVKEASNGKELIELMVTRPADAVILDVEMPVMGGVEAAKIINQRFPSAKILILTLHTEEIFVNRLLDVGIHGLLSKSSEPEELERALYSIIDKDFYKNAIIESALKKSADHDNEDGGGRLTARELEVLLLICEELSAADISERLQISEKTFFNHRANILEKTRARSNVGLYKYAMEKNLFELRV